MPERKRFSSTDSKADLRIQDISVTRTQLIAYCDPFQNPQMTFLIKEIIAYRNTVRSLLLTPILTHIPNVNSILKSDSLKGLSHQTEIVTKG